MSDTPRTDAFEDGRIGSPLDLNEYAALAGFARSLERELNEMRADVNRQMLEALQHRRRLTDEELHVIHESIPKDMPLDEGKRLFAKKIQDAIFGDGV